MNAFHRGHAIGALEELSLIIAIHCVLVASYPESDALHHWEGEVAGFRKTLQRLDRGKKGRHNFTLDILLDQFKSHIDDQEDRETIEAHIAEKGLDVTKIDWVASAAAVSLFANSILP